MNGFSPMAVAPAPLNCPCEGARFSPVFTYDRPPKGEVRFRFNSVSHYHREVLRCEVCGHFISRHQMQTEEMYAGEYVNATYGDGGIRGAFERIISLDPAKSDNVGRVNRLIDYSQAHLERPKKEERAPTVLDVGSGLCVFLHRMTAAGWCSTALDPDKRAVDHARGIVGVKAVCADFMAAENLGCFDLVTFNKVLEHVRDPVAMLSRSAEFLNSGGFVYVEVPDGEAAVREGPQREEFFVEHFHVFSVVSLSMLASRSGLSVSRIERIREPSGKFTLLAYMFLEKQQPVTDGCI